MGYLRSEDAGADVTDHAADAVDGEDIESIVNTDEELELGSEVADDAANDAHDEGAPGGDEAGAGGDDDEAGDGTGAEANGGPLALEAEIEEDPGETAHRGGQVGVEAGDDGADVHGEGGAAVEAEPADPEEDGADDDVGDVVRPPGHAGVVAVAGALAEHEGVGEGGGAGGDVDGAAAGEVEGAQLVEPAVGVPGPVGDGVVDDGGPDEEEDERGKDATAVSDGADGQSRTGEQRLARVWFERLRMWLLT